MAFIGVIADNKYEMQIKKLLDNLLNAKIKKYTIIVINDKSIENIKNIKFETILVMDLKRVEKEEEILNEMFEKLKYLVINADMDSSLNIINNLKVNVITFGFSSKSTITASSVEDNMLLCVQRKIINIEGKILEPQEIKTNITNGKLKNNSHNLMGIATILLIYGKNENFF